MAETGADFRPKSNELIEAADVAQHLHEHLDLEDRWVSGMTITWTGLTLHVATGAIYAAGRTVEFDQQVNEALADNDTNYVFANKDANITVNQTDVAPSDSVKLWEVVTSGGAVTGNTDFRSANLATPHKFKAQGFDADSNLVENVASPVSGTDAANRTYVLAQAAAAGKLKLVAAISTSPGTLATDFENGDTLDGVSLATGDEILLTAQSAGQENGAWTVAASGAPTRPDYFDSSADANSNRGMLFSAQAGTANAKRVYKHTTTATITLETTPLTFEEASVFTHAASEGIGVHGSTAAATASKLVHRDSQGRAKVVDGAVAGDIATKGQVDTVQTNLDNHIGTGGVSEHPNATTGTSGFMSATDKTKLDGVEMGATADQTAAEILAAIKTVDGSGSDLDADLLDGANPSTTGTANSIAKRDASGRLEAANAVTGNDLVTFQQVPGLGASVGTGVWKKHSSSGSATGVVLTITPESGRTEITDFEWDMNIQQGGAGTGTGEIRYTFNDDTTTIFTVVTTSANTSTRAVGTWWVRVQGSQTQPLSDPGLAADGHYIKKIEFLSDATTDTTIVALARSL